MRTSSIARTRHRRLAAISPLLALVLAIGPAQAFEPQEGRERQVVDRGRSAEGVHPTGGEVRWTMELPGDSLFSDADRHTLGLLDDDGHVIYAEELGNFRTLGLVAFDTDTGERAWSFGDGLPDDTGVAPGCTMIAQDGTIWTMVPDRSASRFLAVDPATGTERSSDSFAVPTGSCRRGVHLLPDNRAAYLDPIADEVIVVDLNTGSLVATGATTVEDTFLATSTDGQRLYAWAAGTDPVELVSLDTETGDELGRVTLEGSRVRNPKSVLVDRDGGIVLAVFPMASVSTSHVQRVVDDGAGALSTDWVNPQPSIAASRLLLGGAAADRVIALPNSSDAIVELDLATGDLLNVAEVPCCGNFLDRIDMLTDAVGNLILTYTAGQGSGSNRVAYEVYAPGLALIGTAPPGLFSDAPHQSLSMDSDGTVYIAAATDEGFMLTAIEPGEAGGLPERLDQGLTGPDIALTACELIAPDPGSARSVLLARENVFADALAGAPLAGDDSCILFTPPDTLSAATEAEIARAVGDGGLVRILGGPAAVSTDIETQLGDDGYQVERFQGRTRFETALVIARQVRAENPGNTDALLAVAGNWPDAITGGAYGAETGTPILLTESASLSAEAEAGLTELGVTRTLVLGGEGVISFATAGATPNPVRVAGPNRMATAAAVATDLWGSVGPPFDVVIIANLEREDAWPLALAAAPLSALFNAPQLGARTASLPEESEAYLGGPDITRGAHTLVLGHEAFVDAAVEQRADDAVGQRVGP